VSRASRLAVLVGTALVTAAALAVPAQACSVSPSPEIRREELKQDPHYRRVKGRFTVTATELSGNASGDLVGMITGRIDTERGTGWDVVVEYNSFLIECVYFFAPTIDATGTFWINRRAVDGRHEIMMWEGDYTPEALERWRRENEAEEPQTQQR
jgi:hypothetical protein